MTKLRDEVIGIAKMLRDDNGGWPIAGIKILGYVEACDKVESEFSLLKETLHDEIAANMDFREQGGALPDEDMPTFCARLVAERNGWKSRAEFSENELAASNKALDEFYLDGSRTAWAILERRAELLAAPAVAQEVTKP